MSRTAIRYEKSMSVSRPEPARQQVTHAGRAVLDLAFDDGDRQRVLRLEVEIHCALGQFGLGENVVEPDVVVGPTGELVRRGPQNLLPGRVGASVSRMCRHRNREISSSRPGSRGKPWHRG